MTTRANQAPRFDHRALFGALAVETPPLRQPRRAPALTAAEAAPHAGLGDEAPALYALAALAPTTDATQRARLLYALLAQSRDGFGAEQRALLDRVVAVLGAALPFEAQLNALLALRRGRVNRRHLARFAARLVLVGDRAETIARDRPRCGRAVLEHALGRGVARAAARDALAGRELTGRLRRLVGADDAPRAASRLAALYGPSKRRAALSRAERRDLRARQTEASARLSPRVAAPPTVTTADRGDIVATLHHALRGGMTPALRRALAAEVARAAASLPSFAGHLAVVVDTSASTEGFGERRHAAVAQCLALGLLLERAAKHATVVRVGGNELAGLSCPLGATDLAGALVVALEARPDAVVVLTDGYENHYDGDLAAVCASLPAAGIDTPVLVTTVTFTDNDNIELRRPLARLAPDAVTPAREHRVWHQDELWALLFEALALVPGRAARLALTSLLERRLTQVGA